MQTYEQLLETKIKTHIDSGFDCKTEWAHLYPFQSFCVRRALKAGRYAMFEDCGLGKTRQQLTWANEVVNYTNKAVIILAPLAVVAQTIKEGVSIGIEPIEYHEGFYSLDELPVAVYITNYEQLDHIDPSDFSGIALDESSILKNFEGAIRNALIENFCNTPFKLCCTATPSPNDPMELGNHAEFLNVMSRQEMLAMYFVHDGGETAKWRLKGHCESLFWQFISSFAVMLSKPSDIGFSDEGYILPPLQYHEKTIITPKKDNGTLYNDMAISATTHNAELRLTKVQRLEEVAQIVNSSPESFIIWVKQNEESEHINKLIPGSIQVTGSDNDTWKKDKLLGFANNEYRVLITKGSIAGYGMNFQNCHNMIFASPDFSFEKLYQSIRREWRFGQRHAVNVWLITTDTMENVMSSIKKKQAQFSKMQEEMQKAMNSEFKHAAKKQRKHMIVKTEHASLELGDSLQLIQTLPDESIGFSMWSPPFPELYVYSSELEDLGNCKNYDEFMKFFDFIPSELFRVMWSGRNVVIHCMDTPIQKGKEGYIGLRDFSGGIIKSMENEGFIYHSRVTIWKDPVVEMQRTKALGLLHKQIKKDSAMSRVGIPDYLLVFRKPGEHLHPITNTSLPVDLWQQYASPVWDEWRKKDYSPMELMDTIDDMRGVIISLLSGNKIGLPAEFQEQIWMDIDYGDTLNGRNAREDKDEKHICPLQIPTIQRATHLWTNPGDTCLSMFGGIGSEPATWVEMSRKAIAFELKKSYFDQMVKNVKSAEKTLEQQSLFA